MKGLGFDPRTAPRLFPGLTVVCYLSCITRTTLHEVTWLLKHLTNRPKLLYFSSQSYSLVIFLYQVDVDEAATSGDHR